MQSLKSFSQRVKTLTYDNGEEFAFHAEVSEQLNAKGYFRLSVSFLEARLE